MGTILCRGPLREGMLTVADRDKIGTYQPDERGRINLTQAYGDREGVEVAVLDDAAERDQLGLSCAFLDVDAADVRTVSTHTDGRTYLADYSDREELRVAILDDGSEA